MINVNVEYKLYDYVLFEEGTNTGYVTKLSLFEAQKINFAYRLNRTTKQYILKSEIDVVKSDDSSVLILPKE